MHTACYLPLLLLLLLLLLGPTQLIPRLSWFVHFEQGQRGKRGGSLVSPLVKSDHKSTKWRGPKRSYVLRSTRHLIRPPHPPRVLVLVLVQQPLFTITTTTTTTTNPTYCLLSITATTTTTITPLVLLGPTQLISVVCLLESRPDKCACLSVPTLCTHSSSDVEQHKKCACTHKKNPQKWEKMSERASWPCSSGTFPNIPIFCNLTQNKLQNIKLSQTRNIKFFVLLECFIGTRSPNRH